MGKVYRLSYSILEKVRAGYIDEAINMFNRVPLPSTPAMELGKKYHALWEKQIKATGRIPEMLGGEVLTEGFSVEVKLVKKFRLGDNIIEFVGVYDCYEPNAPEPVLRDWKMTKGSASTYASGYQHCCYKVLVPDAVKFEYRCKHPFIDSLQTAIIHLTPETRQRGLDYIQTYGGEFIQQYEWYLQDNRTKENTDFNDVKL